MERFIIKLKSKLSYIIRRKYLFTFLAMLIYVCFFSQYTIFERVKELSNRKKLTIQKEYYTEKIREDSLKLNDLKTNNKNLVKFAREQYQMKADNEDIFIIREK